MMSAKSTRRLVAQRLAAAGLQPHAVAGIMGNIAHESGFNPKATNPNGGAFGLVQWLGGRKSGLQSFAKSQGKSASNINVQIDYIIKEITSGAQSGPTGRVTIKSLNARSGPEDAAEFFDRNYERSEGTTVAARRKTAAASLGLARKAAKMSPTGDMPTPKVKGSKNGTMTWVPKAGPNTSAVYGQKGGWAAGYHTGTDIQGGAGGQPIRWAPPVTGKVVKVGSNGDYGNHVIIRDEKNRDWLLAHMRDTPKVSKGDTVRQGQMIGRVGDTGNADGAHLHVEQTAPGVKWSYGNTKKPKLVFKVGSNGQVYDKDFKPVKGDYLDAVGLSGQALQRQGNEELQDLVRKAVRNDWTNTEFTRRFKKTQWYIDRAKSQREFDMLQDTEQQQLIKQNIAKADRGAMQLGVQLSDEDKRKLAIKIARDGFTDEQAAWFISRRYRTPDDGDEFGAALLAKEAWKQTAREYGVRLSDDVMNKWTREMIGKQLRPESYDDDIRALAAESMPQLKDAYAKGLTTKEALAPYLSTAASILGTDVDTFDLSDEKWRSVFGVDGNTIPDPEWRRLLKSDQRFDYGNTKNGVDEARRLGRNLARMMGVISNG